jgi:hypothetical protein
MPKQKSKQKKNNEIQHDYECRICGKPATKSVQDSWHSYDISPDGDFEETNSWDGDTNEFYCDKCFDKYN